MRKVWGTPGRWVLALVCASALGWVREREAAACGGCFTPPPPPQVKEVESIITDEKMIFSISKDQTTLFDEIRYSGSPSSFAWVLPIKGTVTVGLSADIMFAAMEQLTSTVVVSPPANCPAAPTCNQGGVGCGSSSAAGLDYAAGSAGSDQGGGEVPPVTVLSQAQVGPYETVQLKSNDGSALENWLSTHGYRIADSDKPAIAAYVSEGFDFLALKLVPGKGVQAMQPVRVTTQGAAPRLPLRMVSVGTGPTTGITIWVIADGRWEPQNFPTFTITDAEISWDWSTNSSNYETLRLSKESALNGRGWQVESSLEKSMVAFRDQVVGVVQAGGKGNYTPSAGFSTTEEGEVDAANKDLDILFTGIAAPNARITRMRSDVAHSALDVDMFLQAATDGSELNNVRHPATEVGQPQCPVYNEQCVQIGTAPRDQAVADANGGGCSATRGRTGSRATAAIMLSLASLGIMRSRRRRASRRR